MRRTTTEDCTVPCFGRVNFVPTTGFDETIGAIRAVTVFAPCARNLRARTVHVLTPIFSCVNCACIIEKLGVARGRGYNCFQCSYVLKFTKLETRLVCR